MINWQSVIYNGFWIFGSSTILAAFSYHYWLARQENRRVLLQLRAPGFLRPFWMSMVLIGIGLVGTSQQGWEMAIWGILTLVALVILIDLFR